MAKINGNEAPEAVTKIQLLTKTSTTSLADIQLERGEPLFDPNNSEGKHLHIGTGAGVAKISFYDTDEVNAKINALLDDKVDKSDAVINGSLTQHSIYNNNNVYKYYLGGVYNAPYGSDDQANDDNSANDGIVIQIPKYGQGQMVQINITGNGYTEHLPISASYQFYRYTQDGGTEIILEPSGISYGGLLTPMYINIGDPSNIKAWIRPITKFTTLFFEVLINTEGKPDLIVPGTRDAYTETPTYKAIIPKISATGSGGMTFDGTVNAYNVRATNQVTAYDVIASHNVSAETAIGGPQTFTNLIHFNEGAQTACITLTEEGSIIVTNRCTASSFNALSDARLKENFQPLIPEKSILDLPTYKFDFINGSKNQIGCKAQDLQEICPEIVNEGDDGMLSIQESKIVYLLLEEIKKLRKEVDELKGSRLNEW